MVLVCFSVSACFSLASYFTSLFHSLFLCLSLFFFFFGPSLVSFYFVFCFLVFCLFVSLPCFFAFVSPKEHQINVHQSFSLFDFLSCFVFQIPFSLSLFFIFSVVLFSSASMFLCFKKDKLKHTFWSTKLITCVLQTVKRYRSLPIFGQILVAVQKHSKNPYFSTFLKATKANKISFWGVILWSKEGLSSGPSLGLLKMANLDQITTPEIYARNLEMCWTPPPHFIVFFDKHC